MSRFLASLRSVGTILLLIPVVQIAFYSLPSTQEKFGKSRNYFKYTVIDYAEIKIFLCILIHDGSNKNSDRIENLFFLHKSRFLNCTMDPCYGFNNVTVPM